MSKLAKFLSSRDKLIGVACGLGIAIGTMGYMARWSTFRKVKRSEYYDLMIANVLAHKALIDYMGEPVGFGSADLDKPLENYNTGSEACFVFPVVGSRTRGQVYFQATKDPTDDKSTWEVDLLQVEVEDRKPDRVVVPIRYPTKASLPNITIEANNDPKLKPEPS